MTPQLLHAIIFPSCACLTDKERSHFIRRMPGNSTSFTCVLLPQHLDIFRPFIVPEYFVLQEVNEDGLHYFVLWDKDDWEHSTERRAALRREFAARDTSAILKRAHAARHQRLTDILFATKIFTREKADAFARSLLSSDESTYAQKAKHLRESLSAIADGKVPPLYIPLTEILKETDPRNLLPAETYHEIQSNENPDAEGSRQPPQGIVQTSGSTTEADQAAAAQEGQDYRADQSAQS